MANSVLNPANNGTLYYPNFIVKCPTSISILLATYNGENYLKEQIESIINQTYQDWTLYISDDGSTDNTLEIIDFYIKKYPDKIILINSPTKKGCSNNFYWLIQSIESEFYMLSDQDDVWLPTKIEECYNIIKNQNEIPTLVGCNDIICNEQLQPIKPDYWYNNKLIKSYLRYNFAGVSCPVSGAQMIFNRPLRDIVIKNLGNLVSYDHWITLLCIRYGKVIKTNKILRKYRIHNHNVIGKEKKLNITFTLQSIKRDFVILKPVYKNWIKFLYYKLLSIVRLRLKF